MTPRGIQLSVLFVCLLGACEWMTEDEDLLDPDAIGLDQSELTSPSKFKWTQVNGKEVDGDITTLWHMLWKENRATGEKRLLSNAVAIWTGNPTQVVVEDDLAILQGSAPQGNL